MIRVLLLFFFSPSSTPLPPFPCFCPCCAGFSQLCSPRRAFSEQGPLRLIKSASFFSGWRLKLAMTAVRQLHACVCCVCVGCRWCSSGCTGFSVAACLWRDSCIWNSSISSNNNTQQYSMSTNNLGQIVAAEMSLWYTNCGSHKICIEPKRPISEEIWRLSFPFVLLMELLSNATTGVTKFSQ